MKYSPIQLEIFKHHFAAIPEEMGVVLKRSSYSPNIKERLDFSCALFDANANMIAQAAHIPVHLGAMPLSIERLIHELDFDPGDVIIFNDPFQGGTHLPDISIVTPIFIKETLFGFAVNRAHHSDVGGMSPGSMSISTEIFQEGLILPPMKLIQRGKLNQDLMKMILSNVRTPVEREGDLKAQIASNQRGVSRILELINRYDVEKISFYIEELLNYSERMTKSLLKIIPNGEYTFTDYLDNDGIDNQQIPISVKIIISNEEAIVDFTGSSKQVRGSVNAVYAITVSAVNYVFRCLLDAEVPNNSGYMRPIKIIAPNASIVNAEFPAPVAAGNVETSQRIVDVLFGALAKALPDKIPAASQGTMNNILIGGWDSKRQKPFTYYETIGGGTGASPNSDGTSATHSHMTNTLNTPIEALEFAFPFQVVQYQIREKTGGKGNFIGGDGIIRTIKMNTDGQLSLLSDRRITKPYGLRGGEPGSVGKCVLIRDGKEIDLPSKGSFELKAGDLISIQTPGGGGFGKE